MPRDITVVVAIIAVPVGGKCCENQQIERCCTTVAALPFPKR